MPSSEPSPYGSGGHAHAERDDFTALREHDAALVDAVTRDLGGVLSCGGSALVIATDEHRRAFEERWSSAGLAIDAVRAKGRYLAVDAHELLSRIEVDGEPDRERFRGVIEPLVARLSVSGAPLAVFGDLVGMLRQGQRHHAAVRIESFWNDLAAAHPLALMCAHADGEGEAPPGSLRTLGHLDSLALPIASYTKLQSDRERLAYVGDLQRRALALDRELARHKAAESLVERRAKELAAALASVREDAHKSDALLAAIVASSDDAIVSKSLDGRISSWNDGAERLFGYTRDEAVGREIMLIVPPELRDEEREILRRLSRGERIDHFETVRARKDGRRIDVSLTISPIRNKEGRVIGASKVARDITERKQIEEERRVAERRKDEFLAMLGHELRNPLAPIRTVTEVLRRTLGDDPRSRELCAILERQVQQMTRLIDDLLDVTQIARGTIRFQRQRLEVSSVIQRAVEASGPLIMRRKQRLRVGVPKTPIYVEGDFARLVQVVTNLLNNAAKYTPVGGRIALRVVRRGGRFDIRVQDNGAGIAPQVLPHVFELFVQSDTDSGVQDGLGIGLTLVRVISEHHGGTVAARSAGPGRGSQFVVTLPASPPGPAIPVDILIAPPPAPSPRKRVVIVDDNRDALESLATLLRLSGHDVIVATDGQTGIRVVEETKPDLALLDIGLPGMSGYEVARRLREDGCTVRLAAVTGYGTPQDRERAHEAGFDHHFVKPIDPASLEELLGSAA